MRLSLLSTVMMTGMAKDTSDFHGTLAEVSFFVVVYFARVITDRNGSYGDGKGGESNR